MKIYKYAAIVLGMLFSAQVGAQGFSALITPPRIEDNVKPGQVYRNVIEITNVSPVSNKYVIESSDWTFNASDASVDFQNELSTNSCRPWVYLESNSINLGPNAKRRFRFEVRVPENAPVQECRFAMLFSGDPDAESLTALPVAGRLAVVVYLRVGNASALLNATSFGKRMVDGQYQPTMTVHNSGNATSRLDGYVDGTDATGKTITFLPTSYPILPGQTNEVVLVPQAPSATSALPAIAYPLTLKGRVDWEGKNIPVETTIP